jgi:hypothetical protein
VLSGEEDLVVCANIAYEKSLKKYHGWIVKGIFKVSCGQIDSVAVEPLHDLAFPFLAYFALTL